MNPIALYITASNREEAMLICRDLLQEHLIGCANITDGASSLYWWQGEIEQSHEAVIIAKSAAHLMPAITQKVKSLHSYSCPCVIAMPIVEGNPEFLQWLESQLASAQTPTH